VMCPLIFAWSGRRHRQGVQTIPRRRCRSNESLGSLRRHGAEVEPYREDYWKLAAVEDRFSQLQGALRTLASTWTLAALAGLAVLSQVAEKTTWLTPPAFLAWVISILSVLGLALLWVMDQFVYQRLLGAAFVSALLLEQRHADLPALRSLMLAGSSGGMSKYLKLFYFAPMVTFLGLGLGVILADATGVLSGAKAMPRMLFGALLLCSVVAAFILLLLHRVSARVGTRALARSLGIDALANAAEHQRLVNRVRTSCQPLHSTIGATTQELEGAAQPGAAGDPPQAARP